MVTVEAAVALSAFVVVLVLGIAAVMAALDQVRCTDAARESARLLARGEKERGVAVIRQIGPSSATWQVSEDGEHISVRVSAAAAHGLLPGLDVHGEAYAVTEVRP